jgi:hypothetical protein
MLGIVGCTLVASYLVAALFALVRMWQPGSHGFRRLAARDTVRVVLEAAAWPLEESWLRLQESFLQAVPRYQEVPTWQGR